MGGFLDPKERIVDVVLTGLGKRLLSRGDLHFTYWIPYDDEIDYDPYVSNSGSLLSSDLAAAKISLTEEPLIREAASGYSRGMNMLSKDQTNVQRPLHTIPSGQTVLPGLKLDGLDDSGGLSITIDQKNVNVRNLDSDIAVSKIRSVGIVRSNSSESEIMASYSQDGYPRDFDLEGILITVHASSSDGYSEVLSNVDSSGSTIFRNDLVISASGSNS